MGEASVDGTIAAFIEETPPLIGYADLEFERELVKPEKVAMHEAKIRRKLLRGGYQIFNLKFV
jgi:hypothetical protein